MRHARKYKAITGLVIALALAGAYAGYHALAGGESEARYIFAPVRRGALEVTVSGSGQVSASSQIEVKAKTSGEVLTLSAVAGKFVPAGAPLIVLDGRDAEKLVRDAEIALENAKISYEKVRGPAGSSVARIKEEATATRARAYDDGFSSVANAFIDLPSLLTDFKEVLQGTTLDKNQENVSWYANQVPAGFEEERALAVLLRDQTRSAYETARRAYDANSTRYKSTARLSPREDIQALIENSYRATQSIADAVKSAGSYIDFVRDFMEEHNFAVLAATTAHLDALNAFTGTLNGHTAKLLSAASVLTDVEYAYTDADLDLAAQTLALKQKENALADAREKLADATIRAPFAGVLAKLSVRRGDSVSSGAAVATLITVRRLAELSLNEVDAARIAVGQKAILSFDAVPETRADGVVSEIDAVGTMSQGVVSYTIKIAFNESDARIKPGMSVTADVVVARAENALFVPNSAIKQSAVGTFVERAGPNSAREQVPISLGFVSDEFTEILAGLAEGERVVVRTIIEGTAQNGARRGNQDNTTVRIPGLQGGSGFRRP